MVNFKRSILIITVLLIVMALSFIISMRILDMVEENKNLEIAGSLQEKEEVNSKESDNKNHLHKSSLEKPSANKSQVAQKEVFENISDSNKKNIQTEMRVYS